MAVYTTGRFASIAESGVDWRDVAKKVLGQLENLNSGGHKHKFNLGFLYISDDLADDAGSILALFRSVTGIENWVGTAGLGVFGTGKEFVDEPAIAAMVGKFDENDFLLFPVVDLDLSALSDRFEPWSDRNEPMLTLVHGDPASGFDPVRILTALEQLTGGFLAGGLGASRAESALFSGKGVERGGFSGAVFSQDVKTMTVLTQGCTPAGRTHTITRCQNNVVQELDGRRALDVFSDDLRELALEKTGRTFEDVFTGEEDGPEDVFKTEEKGFRGEVHVAFPVSGSDQRDYLVRNVLGIDRETGALAVAHEVANGERMMFVHRDEQTVKTDLTRALLSIRERARDEQGGVSIKGALYISCAGRILSDFGMGPGGEAALIREVLGDIPLAGFYANGEISNRRLYRYAAVLILFL